MYMVDHCMFFVLCFNTYPASDITTDYCVSKKKPHILHSELCIMEYSIKYLRTVSFEFLDHASIHCFVIHWFCKSTYSKCKTCCKV